MNEKIYAVLYVLLEICNSFAVYRCLLRVSVTKIKQKQAAALAAMLFIEAAACAGFGVPPDVFALAGVFLLALTWTELTAREAVFIAPLVYVGTAVVNTSGSFFIAWFRGCAQSEIIHSHIWTLVSECTGIVLCLGYGILTRKKRKTIAFRIDAKKYIFMWVGVIGCGFLISAVQCQEQGIALSAGQRRLVGVSGTAFGAVFLAVCIWQMYTSAGKEQIEKENRIYEDYLRIQERYIHTLIDADKTMRSFRHDFRAHALAIRGHAREVKDAWLDAYVDEMIGASDMEYGRRYTKLAAVDAVIQDMVCAAEKEGIRIEWKGALGDAGSIRIYDLCTIFSNLFLNAIEACRSAAGERTIRAQVYRYEKSIYIKMSNPIVKAEAHDGFARPGSKKGDARNHGFGLENVKKAVEAYAGRLSYDFSETACTVEVLLFEQ